MLKKNAFLVLISLAILLLIGLTPSVALASNPLGITLTPTEEATATPEESTATPLPPTPTGPVQPPESSPTPTSQLATPPAPTETPEPEEPEEPEPTRPAPVLPETGQGPLNPSISWTGLFAALGFALIGTLVFRALFRSRMLE